MFRNREAHEYGMGYDVPSDYHLANLSFVVKNLGKVFATSKREYHWVFNMRVPGTDEDRWTPIQVILIDSSFSNKKSLVVNGKKIIDKEKM